MTDNIKDATIEIKDYIIARLKVPIFFYYLLALALWNWDILLMILKSKFDIEDVIWYIKTHYNGHQRLWSPLILAVLSSIAFPIAMVGLDWLLKFVSIARIKSAKLVSVEEANSLYEIQVARNKTNILKKLNDEIFLKDEQIKSLEEQKINLAQLISDEKVVKNKIRTMYDEILIEKEKADNEIILLKESLNEFSGVIDKGLLTEKNLNEEITKLQKNLKEQQQLLNQFKEQKKSYIDLYDELQKQSFNFSSLMELVYENESFYLGQLDEFSDSDVKLLLKYKLIEKLKGNKSNTVYYTVSNYGEQFVDFLVNVKNL